MCEDPVQTVGVDKNICQECGAQYDEDEFQDAWIGCDNDDCGSMKGVPLLVCWFQQDVKLSKNVNMPLLLSFIALIQLNLICNH